MDANRPIGISPNYQFTPTFFLTDMHGICYNLLSVTSFPRLLLLYILCGEELGQKIIRKNVLHLSVTRTTIQGMDANRPMIGISPNYHATRRRIQRRHIAVCLCALFDHTPHSSHLITPYLLHPGRPTSYTRRFSSSSVFASSTST